jgi:FtsZ-binding cell division protein ZapB
MKSGVKTEQECRLVLTPDFRRRTPDFTLALASAKSHNRSAVTRPQPHGEVKMVGLTGLEKFSHLEDKIYRTIELTKTLRQEKEALDRELATVRRELGSLLDEKDRLETQVERLLSERDTIRAKVEAMLDAIAVLDPEAVEVMRR